MTDGRPSGDGLTVTGGRGGTTARLEDMRRTADALSRAAESLGDAHHTMTREHRWVRDHCASDPALVSGAEAVLQPLITGAHSLDAAADRCRDLASAMRRAVEVYSDAEGVVGALARRYLSVNRVALGGLGFVPAVWQLRVGTAAGGAVLRTAQTTAVGALAADGHLTADGLWTSFRRDGAEVAVGGVGDVVDAVLPPSPMSSRDGRTSVGRAAGTVSMLLPRTPMVVSEVGRRRTATEVDVSAAALARRIEDGYPRNGGESGSVVVQRVEHADGPPSWVVSIPGTQSGTVRGGTNPFDNQTNVRLMAGLSNDSAELVSEALLLAGAGPGQKVLLAGHSQGGMAAAYLAQNPTFAERYDVAAVATFGSPVASVDVPRGTEAVHFEAAEDLIPATDGAADLDRPNVTTVQLSLLDSDDVRDRTAGASVGGAHEIETYQRIAARFDASQDPSVVAWRQRAEQVVGTPTAVTTMTFQGVRTLPAPAVPALPAVPTMSPAAPPGLPLFATPTIATPHIGDRHLPLGGVPPDDGPPVCRAPTLSDSGASPR